jgi:hypothetical protein
MKVIHKDDIDKRNVVFIPCSGSLLGLPNWSIGTTLPDEAIKAGWRYFIPTERNQYTKATEWTDNGTDLIESVTETWTDEDLAAQETQRQAEAAAAQAAEALAPRDVELGKATLRTYPDGSVELLSGPLILPGTATGAYEVWVDSTTGLVLTTLDHASPRKSKSEKDAAKAEKLAKVAAVKAANSDKAKLDALLDLLGLK